MNDRRSIEQHGSRIVAALEHAWAAIQDQHPDVPGVVIVTGAGPNQKGIPEGYRLRGHHWPERWVLGGQDQARAPELFIAGELLAVVSSTSAQDHPDSLLAFALASDADYLVSAVIS